MIGYLDKVIRPLVLMMPKMSGYVRISKVKDGYRDKNNKLMFFQIDDEKLLEKYKATWFKIEDLKKYWIKCFNNLWRKCIETKIKTEQ